MGLRTAASARPAPEGFGRPAPLPRDASRTAAQRSPPGRAELVPGAPDTGAAAGGRGRGLGRPDRHRALPARGGRGRPGAGAVRARAEGGRLVSVREGRAGGGRRAFRVYRIDRFTAVDAGEERFARDDDFDLPTFWAERAEQFARSILRAEVVVRLSAEGVRGLAYVLDARSAQEALEDVAAPDADGWVTVTLPVESEEVAHTQLRGLGPEVEVLAPEALRERFAREARRLAGLYGYGAIRGRDGRDVRRRAPGRHITIRSTPRAYPPSRTDAGPVMDETEFWELIDATRQGCRRRSPRTRPTCSWSGSSGWTRTWCSTSPAISRPATTAPAPGDLWGAAWVLLGGASDDAFDYFRCWLIGQGREVLRGRGARARLARRAAGRLRRGAGRRRRGTSATRPTRPTSSSPAPSPPISASRPRPRERWAPRST